MIELEHSPLGGSSAWRFMNCDGSFLKHAENLANGTHEDVPSEFAERGTGAHELAAICVAGGEEPFEYLGETFNGYIAGWPGGIELDAVQVYVNECFSIMAQHGGKPGALTIIEDTITLPEIHPLFKGTVDFGLWVPGEGVWIRDYKNGEGIGVSAVGNRQLLYYASLMILADPWLRSAPRDLPVSLGIVQPNFYGIYEDPDVWETTLGYVLDWCHNELLPQMNKLASRFAEWLANREMTLTFETDFNSGEWCQFCPVMLECPKLTEAFLDYAEHSEDFITMLTNKELDDLYAKREDARRFMKALETTVYARKITGAPIASAKLVEKKVNRVWKPGAADVLKKAFGEKAYKPKELISPAAAEKLSSRGKELALEYGYKPEAHALTIAPLSDPRPEAKPKTNADVFQAFQQSAEEAGF